MSSRADYLIVGGGIIGLMLARALSGEGGRVCLLERGRCGQEASWAGGGIVSPLYPWRYSLPVTRLAGRAQGFYPLLAAELLDETGVDIELHTCGLLMLSVKDAHAARAWADSHGRRMEAVGPRQVAAIQPGAAMATEQALWMSDVANVRNPKLLQALLASLRGRPQIDVREHVEVTGILRKGQNVRGVQTSDGDILAESTIICAGAWSSPLLESVGVALPIAPVRGQMLMFRAPPDLLRCILLADGRYLIPRADGHILVGSTLEYVGYERAVTRSAYNELYRAAIRLLPALEDTPVIMHWSGLRPGSPDGVPFMGRVEPYSGLFVSAGHFRNGLVLAPAATEFMLGLLQGRNQDAEVQDYLPTSSRAIHAC